MVQCIVQQPQDYTTLPEAMQHAKGTMGTREGGRDPSALQVEEVKEASMDGKLL